ncbi:MAG: acyl-ACP thioesterase [Spirochaetales bacterium]|nr:acyl-ACP thioesterase [Spirochaetales bacterium]
MKEHREDSYTVRSYDVDIRRRLRLSCMMDYFQESAWRHAEELGVGVQRLGEEGCFWVLSRLCVEVERYPVWNEQVTLRTWPKGIDRLFALRDFLLFDEAGETCARASTAWLILHGERRRPVRVEPFFQHLLSPTAAEALPGTPEKIDPLTEDVSAGCRRSGYAVLDMNRHVNNARYADWVLDSFPLERFDREGVRKFSIQYLAEIGPETEVDLRSSSPEEGVCLLSGRSGSTEHFRSRVVWSSSIR